MKVFATILHYDIPVQLVLKYGGWKNRKTIDFTAAMWKCCSVSWAIW